VGRSVPRVVACMITCWPKLPPIPPRDSHQDDAF
jgi:hypothetical protein